MASAIKVFFSEIKPQLSSDNWEDRVFADSSDFALMNKNDKDKT